MHSSRAPGARRVVESRGFTLVELVAVVAIMGVLATIAIYSLRKYIQHAKTSEAAEIIASIKAGQEAYYDETFRYLQVDSGANTPERFYPDTPENASGKIKIQWGVPSVTSCTNCGTRYKALGVLPTSGVLFRYSCVISTTTVTTVAGGISTKVSGTPPGATTAATQPFYVINAVSDLNGNGTPMTAMVGSNLMTDLYSSNVGE